MEMGLHGLVLNGGYKGQLHCTQSLFYHQTDHTADATLLLQSN